MLILKKKIFRTRNKSTGKFCICLFDHVTQQLQCAIISYLKAHGYDLAEQKFFLIFTF